MESELTATGLPETIPIETPLRHEGVSKPFEDIPEIVRPHVIKASKATSLADLLEDYVFFSHAALFCYGGWDERLDPLINLIMETNGAITPFHLSLPSPVFKYLDTKDENDTIISQEWNRTLILCPKDQWSTIQTFLLQIAGVNRETKIFLASAMQKIPIVDVLAMEKKVVLPDKIPLVDCHVVAALTNKRTAKFAPEYKKHPLDPVPIVLSPANLQVMKLAKKVFAYDYKPMAGTMEANHEEAIQTLKESVK